MPSLPMPLRAAVGLVASAVDEARHLPDRAIELPMLAISTALQVSLQAQQRYANLAAKGDEILSRRTVTDEPPEWATFDDTPDDIRHTVPGSGATARQIPTPGKKIPAPRKGKPSRFDTMGDE
jgi:hypothetical protein